MPVNFTGAQHGGGKFRPVWRIGERLCLQAEGTVFVIGNAEFSDLTAIEEIGGEKLHARLIGESLHNSTGLRIPHPRGQTEALALSQDPARIISVSEIQRFKILVDPLADGRRFREIHRRFRNRSDLTGRDHFFVRRQIMIRFNGELVIADGSLRISGKVPVAVIDQIDDGRPIRRRGNFPFQFVGIGQGIDDADLKISGISLFVIFGKIRHFHAALGDGTGKKPFVKTGRSAVEMMRAAVFRQ